MTVARKNRLNVLVGLVLISVVSIPTLTIVHADMDQPAFGPNFAPANAWLWLGFQLLIAFGFVLATLGLVRRIHWGYCVWSQAVLSLVILLAYIGWMRREDDYRRWPDPDDFSGPPEATWTGFLWLGLFWLVPGLLPLALRTLNRYLKARKSSPSAADPPHE